MLSCVVWIILSLTTDGVAGQVQSLYWRTSKYWISDKMKNWTDSEKACTKLGGHLVSLHSKQENLAVKSMLEAHHEYWIGLHDRNEEGSFTWTDGSAINYKDWRRGEPNGRRAENCVHYSKATLLERWNDLNCGARRKYICKIPGLYRYQQFYYWMPNKTLSWHSASNYCKQHGTNLASIKDRNENDVIKKVISHYQALKIGLNIWIGLNDVKKEGQYVWTDGTEYSFKNWSPGEPNNQHNKEDCVHMTNHWQWKWNDNTCSHQMKFICKFEGSSTKTACEDSRLTITCPVGAIRIIYANFGRESLSQCASSASHNITNCRASSSLQTVTAACEGKTSCSIDATNTVFGDPCANIQKYLEVRYQCLQELTNSTKKPLTLIIKVEDSTLKETVKKLHYLLIGVAVLSFIIIASLIIVIFFLKKSAKRTQRARESRIPLQAKNSPEEWYTGVFQIHENEKSYQSLKMHPVTTIYENHPTETVAQDRAKTQNTQSYDDVASEKIKVSRQDTEPYDDVVDTQKRAMRQGTKLHSDVVHVKEPVSEQGKETYDDAVETEEQDTGYYIQLVDDTADTNDSETA